jgi:cysteine desulfurase
MSIFDVVEKETYLDNAATTEMAPEVVDAMQAYLEERYGNPETPYRLGRESREAVDEARQNIASLMGADPEEVFFTSGGTEANNWAIKGGRDATKPQLMVSSVEHSSVLESAEWVFGNGANKLHLIPVDEDGLVDMAFIKARLKKGGLGIVSVQFGNNEVGTLQPIKEIADLCHEKNVTFHCDAVQAYGKMPVDVKELGVDLMTISGHKIHGPMGVGALYIKKGVEIQPLLHGGDHERGMRAGTMAVAQIVGFGKAARMAKETMREDGKRMCHLIEMLAGDLCQKIDAVRNGHPNNRLPHILSVTVPGMESALLAGILADVHGCCVGTGSACGVRRKGSHVLQAMGRTHTDSNSTLRISVSRNTVQNDLIMFVAKLQKAVSVAKRRELL